MIKYIVLWSCLLVAGCGYSTSGCIYAGEKIIISPVQNNIDITSEDAITSGYSSFPILVENKLTNKLVGKFNIDGSLKVVSDDPGAHKLACVITNYTKGTLRYESDDDVREQRLRLHVHMVFTSPEAEELINKTVVGESSYFLTGANATSESAAQVDLIDDTARRISEAIIEEW